MQDYTPAGRPGLRPSPSDTGLGQATVGATTELMTQAPAAAAALLPRVLGDAPVAVLLVDRTAGQVTFANSAALALAGDVGLPIPTDRWSAAAGVTNLDGRPLAGTEGPLSLVAAGDPVAGEPIRIRGTTAVAGSDRSAGDDRGPVVWATGFPLGPTEDGDQLSLVVFLPVEQPTGVEDPEQTLRSLRERAVLATDICFTISDPRQPGNPLVWVNPAFTRITGYAVQDALGRNCKFLQGPATDPAVVARLVADLGAGQSTAVTLLNYRPDGTAFWNHVAISPVHDGAGELVSFVGIQTDVTARVAADAERDAALAAERRARRAAETAQAAAETAQAAGEAARARMALMAAATTVLTDSLDPGELQKRLARLCVPLLGDWVTVLAVDEANIVTAMTSLHRDGPAADGLLAELQEEFLNRPLPPAAPSARAIAIGEPVVATHLDAVSLQPYARGLEASTVLEGLGTGSVLAVPLASRRGAWGAFTLVRADPDGFSDDDVDVAYDLGRRAGQALAIAHTYTREASVAETLQHALLPGLPAIDGIQAAARYTAASDTASVGGDFYDLLPLPGGAIGIVIGDVAGHDITAAAAMGQLRNLIRSTAWDDRAPAPDAVLTRVDEVLDALQLPVIATAALMRATPPSPGGDSWQVECANAGHPPVLMRTPEGRVQTFCEEHGLLLGTGMAGHLGDRTCTVKDIPIGSQLLLFTDGLIEQPTPGDTGPTRDLDAGLARLEQLWASLPPAADPAEVCAAVEALVTSRTDDTAILVLELGTPTSSTRPAVATAGVPQEASQG